MELSSKWYRQNDKCSSFWNMKWWEMTELPPVEEIRFCVVRDGQMYFGNLAELEEQEEWIREVLRKESPLVEWVEENTWYKNEDSDKAWWKETWGRKGEFIFSFDKKTEFNLFQDYPWKLTPEQKEIFDKENPYWADFFKDRK